MPAGADMLSLIVKVDASYLQQESRLPNSRAMPPTCSLLIFHNISVISPFLVEFSP
ncbi:hypothetical protein ABID22_003926 [Pontibacter aydingkolensis]